MKDNPRYSRVHNEEQKKVIGVFLKVVFKVAVEITGSSRYL